MIAALTRVSIGRIRTMWILIAVIVGLSAALLIDRARANGRVDQASLGRMSVEWLAEHGASTRY